MIGLADALRIRATLGELPRDSTFAEALTIIRDALELSPDYDEAYLQLGDSYRLDANAAAERVRLSELQDAAARLREEGARREEKR